ncbi:MAG: MBL fold metallo-hydrolase [Bdellovibrionales bacterium]|jgi:glyoxylase-like metal-dependent hydrolase (beta-lactamase superfamily II)|nr:MBL fold metallo-hydrolase [Bdellovibrionales bacterium]
MSTQAHSSFRDLPNPHASALQEITLTIGEYRVHAAPTGLFGLDGGAMFGTVPKVLWAKSNPADDSNRIAMEARTLLLVSSNRVVLIDTGIGGDFVEKYGEKLGPKFAEMYAIDRGQTSLEASLAKLGLNTSDITDVVLTHLHFDHAGGATKWNGTALVPTFEKATYYIQKRNLEIARNPNRRERASYYAANFEPLERAGVLRILEGPVSNLLPSISVGVSDGHTEGQQYVRISDGKTTLYYCGDVIPTSSHVRLPWVMGYDLRPLDLIEEKAKLLDQAVKENAYLFFEHDPYMDMTQVAAERGDFTVTNRFLLK